MWSSSSTSLISSSSLIFGLFSGSWFSRILWVLSHRASPLHRNPSHSSEGKSEFSVTLKPVIALKLVNWCLQSHYQRWLKFPPKNPQALSRDRLISRSAFIKAKNPPANCHILTAPCQAAGKALLGCVTSHFTTSTRKFCLQESLKIQSKPVKATERFYHSPAWRTKFLYMCL